MSLVTHNIMNNSICTLFDNILIDIHKFKSLHKNLHNKIFNRFFEMGVVYEEEIAYISSRIRELRKEKHLTVQELAYRCDMERSNLSRIEAGRTNLTIRTICIICSALEVGLRDIIR